MALVPDCRPNYTQREWERVVLARPALEEENKMEVDNILALDIETIKTFPQGDDWHDHRPLGISVVAIASSVGNTQWFAAGDDGYPGAILRLGQMDALVDLLIEEVAKGATLVTWNGMGFDWPVIAEESKRLEDVQELAYHHVDMMYHFFCATGFPLALKTAAWGMGVGTKMEGVAGANAPTMWASGDPADRERVVHYCAQDAALTLRVAIACQEAKELRWTSRSGRPNQLALPNGWETVSSAPMMPEPDTSWMADPMNRHTFDAWLAEPVGGVYAG